MSRPPRRIIDPLQAAEAAFKAATTRPAETPPNRAAPGARELISLRLDSDVIERFQSEGPGWQERMNQALRKAAGL